MPVQLRNPVFQALALVIGIGVFVVLTFSSSFASMWDLWQSSDHRHGILVFPISAFLIWQLRHEIADTTIGVDARGVMLLVPIAAGWIVARLAGIQVAEHLFAISLIPAAVGTFAGFRLLRKVLFPLIFLFFATPLRESLVPSLMRITADISTALLELSGFPLLRNGQYISLPGGEFVVADVCAGLHYLSTGVMIAFLYGYLTYNGIRKRLMLVVATAVALVVANGVRAYIVMAVASATRMEYLGGRDHIYFGWLLFGIVMMTIMWIGARYADKDLPPAQDPTDTMVIRASRSMVPLIIALGLIMLALTLRPLRGDYGETGVMLVATASLLVFIYILLRGRHGHWASNRDEASENAVSLGWKQLLTGGAAIAVLLVTPRLAATIENGAVSRAILPDPAKVSSCAAQGAWQAPVLPRFANAASQQSLTMLCADGLVGVFMAGYSSAVQGAELISSSQYVTPPQWDEFISESSISLPGGTEVGEIEVRNPDYQGLFWFWYEVDGRMSASRSETKLNQLIALLKRRPAGGTIVVLETGVGDDPDSARKRLLGVAERVIAEQQTSASGRQR